MGSVSQLNRHHQKEVNYSKGLKKQKRECWSDQSLLWKPFHNSSPAGSDCTSDISEDLNHFTRSFMRWRGKKKGTLSRDGAAVFLQLPQNKPNRKLTTCRKQFPAVFPPFRPELCVGVAVFPGAHLHTPFRPASHNALLFFFFFNALLSLVACLKRGQRPRHKRKQDSAFSQGYFKAPLKN